MWPRLRRGAPQDGGGTAVAVPEAETVDELRDRIEVLSEANRVTRDPETERELLRLRHLAGIRLLDSAPAEPAFAAADTERLPSVRLPDLLARELAPGLLRAAILRDGCALVRGLVAPAEALAFAEGIDRAYAVREQPEEDGAAPALAKNAYYEEFAPDPRFGPVMWRAWIEEGGGLLAADSPRLSFEMAELFRSAGLPGLVSDYLGEPALISVHKTTLRKAEPAVSGAWHQDGFFMGPVRALNVWLSLSHCGDVAPGLDIVPRRLDRHVATGTEGTQLGWTISEDVVQEAASDAGIIRPIFEPGDALLFDELFLHKTGSDPAMPKPRFAIESWFFGGSAFPADYAPIAV